MNRDCHNIQLIYEQRNKPISSSSLNWDGPMLQDNLAKFLERQPHMKVLMPLFEWACEKKFAVNPISWMRSIGNKGYLHTQVMYDHDEKRHVVNDTDPMELLRMTDNYQKTSSLPDNFIGMSLTFGSDALPASGNEEDWDNIASDLVDVPFVSSEVTEYRRIETHQRTKSGWRQALSPHTQQPVGMFDKNYVRAGVDLSESLSKLEEHYNIFQSRWQIARASKDTETDFA